MSYLIPAQAGAQFISLFVYGALALWYVAPSLNQRTRAEALIPLLWVHVFRYVALNVFSAQHTGFPISDAGAVEIAIGDVAGAVMAFAAIALLRRRVWLAIPLAWVLALETIYDTITNIQGGVREHLMGAASGVTWFVLVFFVPAVIVSTVVLVWQLYSRRGEALDGRHARAPHPSAGASLRA